jgi:probable HAF family extracellular repeat protein
MRIWRLAGLSFSCVLAFAAISAVAAGKTYDLTTIDVPGAIATNIIGGISDRGDIVGSYTDAAKKTHGFLLSNGVLRPLMFLEQRLPLHAASMLVATS